MYRTHNCGELRMADVGKTVKLSGWVQKSRDKGFMMWIDLRDRYGITQLILDENASSADLLETARSLGREYVVRVEGEVIERSSKNDKMPTGNVEIKVTKLEVLNESKTPPFTIESETDGGEDLRMKYRYLDLRRAPIRENLFFRSRLAIETRKYLAEKDFIEVETPNLIKSTPEGARDFVVPSRLNPGQFYALPQSPQTFKQLLMVSGFEKYFQIVRCFRDEDLRADRQPEFTQIDCEMSFVTQEDILNTFEGLTKHVFKTLKGIELADFPRMYYDDAMKRYGIDKPDLRFGMEFVELNDIIASPSLRKFYSYIEEFKNNIHNNEIDKEIFFPNMEKIINFILKEGTDKLRISPNEFKNVYNLFRSVIESNEVDNEIHYKLYNKVSEFIEQINKKRFSVFESAELVVGICAKGVAADYSRKKIDKLTDWVKRPQIGAKGLVYVKFNEDGTIKSPIGKFYSDDDLRAWGELYGAEKGDMLLILSGELDKTRKQMGELRLEMGRNLGLMKEGDFKPLWVIDFPLLEWDEDSERFHAMHHPFTSPKKEHLDMMMNGDHESMKNLRADAYDLVINGSEIGGGSIRIHDRALQSKNFKLLGFTPEEAEAQFGFLLGAFEFGAPPHGGIAFGFDRLCAVMNGQSSIRDFIAFPKNNTGRDMMIDAPSPIHDEQFDELYLESTVKDEAEV